VIPLGKIVNFWLGKCVSVHTLRRATTRLMNALPGGHQYTVAATVVINAKTAAAPIACSDTLGCPARPARILSLTVTVNGVVTVGMTQ
jgi:hypothetical protein